MTDSVVLYGNETESTLRLAPPDSWDHGYTVKIIATNSVSWRTLSLADIRTIHEWAGSVLAEHTPQPVYPEAAE